MSVGLNRASERGKIFRVCGLREREKGKGDKIQTGLLQPS
jgi:hypothetical protein